MPIQCGNSSFFIQLEWDNEVRLQFAGKLSHHYNRIITIRTGRSTGGFVCNDLTAAGLADVNAQTV